jgi:hypothetical protein
MGKYWYMAEYCTLIGVLEFETKNNLKAVSVVKMQNVMYF